MRSNRLLSFIAAALLTILAACGGGGGSGSSSNAGGTIEGSVQKGPFVHGSDVVVQGRDASLALTGSGYFTLTSGDNGTFSLDVPLRDPYVEVRTTGYYFNEVSGQLSAGPISLGAIAPFDASGRASVQVNLLTTFERDRIVALLRGGTLTFAEARQRAEAEILQAFSIPPEAAAGRPFTAFDMELGDSAAQALVAVSSIVQGANTEAQLTELIARLSSELAANGGFSASTRQLLAAQAAALDPAAIRANLQRRYTALGRSAVVPDPGAFIDLNRPILEPVLTVQNGDRSSDGLSVSAVPATPGTQVYYRTEDAQSTPNGPWLTGGQWKPWNGDLQFSAHPGTLVVSFYAQSRSDATLRSPTVTRTFTLAAERTRLPTFTPAAGTYLPGQTVELSDLRTDAVIYYTTDGSEPGPSSQRYTGPIVMPSGASTLLKAMAIAPFSEPSVVVTSFYRIDANYVDQGWPGFASLAEARQKIVGRWIGRVSTPWLPDYNGIIEFRADGLYTILTLSDPWPWLAPVSPASQADFTTFLYYGRDALSHPWQLGDLDAAGRAVGGLALDEGGWTLDLKAASMSPDGGHLRFDLFNAGYGPMHYELTRLP